MCSLCFLVFSAFVPRDAGESTGIRALGTGLLMIQERPQKESHHTLLDQEYDS